VLLRASPDAPAARYLHLSMYVNLQTLGCRLNEAELQTWARQFEQYGFGTTSAPEAADLMLVNTCAVTAEAVRKSRQLLRRARRANPRAKLVVSGCLASLEGDTLVRDAGIDLLVPNRDKDRLVAIVVEKLDIDRRPPAPSAPTSPLGSGDPSASPPLAGDAFQENALLRRGRQRAFVKVQDGCRYRCTFCIVTLARGEERSRPIADVVAEVDRLHAEGIREIVLTGVHLGGYGSDLGTDIGALIDAVLADTDMPRVRLGSLEPWDLPPGFWSLFENPRLMPHLHLPLQSGSDAVLRRMARRCGTRDFARLIEQGRRALPDFNPTTDVMVGFPGETECEWRETLSFVAALDLGQIHVFPFSPRPGTKAAAQPGQVGGDTKKERTRALIDLGHAMRRKVLARFVGRHLPVLVEGEEGAAERDRFGYTPNYLPVRIRAPMVEDLGNRIVSVTIEALDAGGSRLVGRPSPGVGAGGGW